jgi:hypothetical protein
MKSSMKKGKITSEANIRNQVEQSKGDDGSLDQGGGNGSDKKLE